MSRNLRLQFCRKYEETEPPAQENKINEGEREIISTGGNFPAPGTFCREDSHWH